MISVRSLHKIVGLVFVIVFLLTGQYMQFYLDMTGLQDGMRMMLRSTHVYILLAGLLNLAVGLYLDYSDKRWSKMLQRADSALILTAPAVLTIAFFYEPGHTGLRRPLTEPALIALLAGTLSHLASRMLEGRE